IKADKIITGTSDVRTGRGQLSGDATFTLSVNGGAPTTVTVHPKSSGVTAVLIANGGSGYTSAPAVSFSGGGGSGPSGTALFAGSGHVTGVTITNPGSGYTSAPTVSLRGGGGTGASGFATVSVNTTAAQLAGDVTAALAAAGVSNVTAQAVGS